MSLGSQEAFVETKSTLDMDKCTMMSFQPFKYRKPHSFWTKFYVEIANYIN